MVARSKDLWSLVWGKPYIHPGDLADAVTEQAVRPSLDFRTRLLIRDSIDALKEYWGLSRLTDWLFRCPSRASIESICHEELGEPGFSTIKERLVEKTDPAVVRELFRNLGTKIRRPVTLFVGGSIALIMPGLLERVTDDIDVVDELPKEVRAQHALLDQFPKLYGLQLGHFQSHYLPSGWDQRLHYLDTFADLKVYLVDPYDVFLSKLTSIRTKDMADMRTLVPQLDKDTLVQRLKDTTAAMLASEELRKRTEKNWYILFGESLPA